MAESGSRDLMPAADWSRLEKEYERRQQEILLEAEAAVKAREEALNQVTLSTKNIYSFDGKYLQELARLREELERQRGLQADYITDKLGHGHQAQHEESHAGPGCGIM